MKLGRRIILSVFFIFEAIPTLPGEPRLSLTQAQDWLSPSDIVVVEEEQGRLLVIKQDGRTQVLADQLQAPQGVTLARDGRSILVAEAAAGRITRIRLGEGNVTKETVQSELNLPMGVAIDDCSGDVLITTFGDGRLLRLSPDGGRLEILTEDLNGPKGVVGAGDIFVVEQFTGSLVRVSSDGREQRRVTEGLSNPEMITRAPNGLIYVAESTPGRISEVNPQTGERRVIVSGLDRPLGIAVGGGGSLITAPSRFRLIITHDHEVLEIDPRTTGSRRVKGMIKGAGCTVIPGFMIRTGVL